jgi:F-box protein GID2
MCIPLPTKPFHNLLSDRKKSSLTKTLFNLPAMKRPVEESSSDPASTDDDAKTNKKPKPDSQEPNQEPDDNSSAVLTDENLLYEVLKHADARTVALSACVSKQWHKTANDERLWEMICTKHSGGTHQLRSVVLALGGFRRLHSLYLWPLSKPSSSAAASASSSAWPCLPLPPPVVPSKSVAAAGKKRWGKDEVHLSLSLLSIRYYEKMNFNNRGK